MLIPDVVATVSTAFRVSVGQCQGPIRWPGAGATLLAAARQAIADLVNGDPAWCWIGPIPLC